MDLDKCIQQLYNCIKLEESELKQLCHIVKMILIEESNVQPINSPVTVCGDIHGQFYDLLELFKQGGPLPYTKYIFMGDLVDRGHYSVETIELLFAFKARYPDSIILLRGNHESRQVTHMYGFYEECLRKYGNSNVWRYCCEVFDYLNLAALIDGKIFCVHGGLSPEISMIDQIRLINRNMEIPISGPFCDLMWSDPEDIETWEISPRGAGYIFGARVTTQFSYLNDIELTCRAHQLVQEGYKYHFPEKNLITVWSAPNYCYRCGNIASIVAFDEYLDREVKTFRDTPEPGMPQVGLPSQYFY